MRTKLKKVIDSARTLNHVGITDYKTGQNQHEINCGKCGKIFYADKETFIGFERAVKQDLDTSFLCADCQKEIWEKACQEH